MSAVTVSNTSLSLSAVVYVVSTRPVASLLTTAGSFSSDFWPFQGLKTPSGCLGESSIFKILMTDDVTLWSTLECPSWIYSISLILFHRRTIINMLARKQLAEKWPFSAGQRAGVSTSNRSAPPPRLWACQQILQFTTKYCKSTILHLKLFQPHWFSCFSAKVLLTPPVSVHTGIQATTHATYKPLLLLADR